MEGINKLNMATKAGYAFFYIRSYELDRAIEALKELFKDKVDSNKFFVWDFEKNPDPEELLFTTLDTSPAGTVVVAKNFHWWLVDEYKQPNKQFITFFQNRFEAYTTKEYRKIFIIIGDVSISDALPINIAKEFFEIEFTIPNADEIKIVYDELILGLNGNDKFKVPDSDQETKIINAAKGMGTLRSIKNALSYAVVEGRGEIKPKTVSLLKASDVEKTAGLKIVNVNYTLDQLRGYGVVKDFALRSYDDEDSLGLLLLGPAGTGKTRFAYALGNTTGRPVFELEIAELFGGLVGDSERLWRQAIEIVSANTPCILIIDEIDKGLPSKNESGGDGGTTKRSASQLLKFLSDKRPKGVYVLATCNRIENLPAEWVRSGRWDDIFFIDLPNEEERAQILAYYIDKYNVKGNVKNMDGWSGAEIESLCRIAKMLKTDLDSAEQFVKPISKTMAEDIKTLREWSVGRTTPASAPLTIKKERSISL
jgi:SpoVK/Ycf46/Vps4 family AAA+-type ATPase